VSIESEAIAVIRRWNDEGWSAGHVEVADEVISPEFTVHGAGGQDVKPGLDGLKGLITAWRTGFPDGVMHIEDIFAEGDTVVIRQRWEGTHRGEFMGVPATGRRVTITCIGIDRVVDGKVVEGWGELDMLGLMQQIGAIPSFTSAGG
jgi:predicted ester cyclase